MCLEHKARGVVVASVELRYINLTSFDRNASIVCPTTHPSSLSSPGELCLGAGLPMPPPGI